MLVFLSVMILIAATLTITLRAGIELTVDALQKRGNFCVILFGIRIVCKDFWTKDDFVTIETDNAELLSVQDPKTKKSRKRRKSKPRISVKQIIQSPLIENLQIPRLDVEFNIGLAGDAFATVLGFSASRVLLYAIFGFMRTRFNSKINETLMPCFEQSCLSLKMRADASLGVADLLVGLFIIIMRKIKEVVKSIRKRGKNQHEYIRAS